MSTLKELVEYLAKSLVNDPDAVAVREVEGGTVTVFELSVAPDDIGRVIGRGGRVVNAMVTLLNVAAAKKNKHVEIEILKLER